MNTVAPRRRQVRCINLTALRRWIADVATDAPVSHQLADSKLSRHVVAKLAAIDVTTLRQWHAVPRSQRVEKLMFSDTTIKQLDALVDRALHQAERGR